MVPKTCATLMRELSSCKDDFERREVFGDHDQVLDALSWPEKGLLSNWILHQKYAQSVVIAMSPRVGGMSQCFETKEEHVTSWTRIVTVDPDLLGEIQAELDRGGLQEALDTHNITELQCRVPPTSCGLVNRATVMAAGDIVLVLVGAQYTPEIEQLGVLMQDRFQCSIIFELSTQADICGVIATDHLATQGDETAHSGSNSGVRSRPTTMGNEASDDLDPSIALAAQPLRQDNRREISYMQSFSTTASSRPIHIEQRVTVQLVDGNDEDVTMQHHWSVQPSLTSRSHKITQALHAMEWEQDLFVDRWSGFDWIDSMGPNALQRSGVESDTRSHSTSVSLDSTPGAHISAARSHEGSTTYNWQEPNHRNRRVKAQRLFTTFGLRVIRYEPWSPQPCVEVEPNWATFSYPSRLRLAVPTEARRHRHGSLVQGVYRIALDPKLTHEYIVILKLEISDIFQRAEPRNDIKLRSLGGSANAGDYRERAVEIVDRGGSMNMSTVVDISAGSQKQEKTFFGSRQEKTSPAYWLSLSPTVGRGGVELLEQMSEPSSNLWARSLHDFTEGEMAGNRR
ncbi:hypothetical protein FFLO_07057 [Filobasidium floriforme]|uniref:Uncharacterized protein n=1 Tax=Filobasidium floriforme TaxID=5210 RepID=A0A8K0JE14_9TREE|nr:hypothetical protein FFLO_07057 [Filobasidium floriforme]